MAIACDFSEFWLGFRRQTHPRVFLPSAPVKLTTATPANATPAAEKATTANPAGESDDDDNDDEETGTAPYTNWVRGEPNNFGNRENCVSLRRTVDDCNIVYWNDVPCSGSHRQRFVCEI